MVMNFYDKKTKTYNVPRGVEDIVPFRRDAEITAIEEGIPIIFSCEGGSVRYAINPEHILNGVATGQAKITSLQKTPQYQSV